MSARVTRSLSAATCLLGFALAATPAPAATIQQVPIGPRAIGMASAFTSISDDATAMFWNPAGIARIGHQEIVLAHADLFRTGIRDNVAAFVLPLSYSQAVGGDWYHSGYDDDELGFSENRVDLAWALKARPWLWTGVVGKLVTRRTDLDGTTLRSGRGFGLDLGALAAPRENIRLGVVAHDLFDTKIDNQDGGSDVAYPRSLRFGASYTRGKWGTAAFDLDDRWHLGLELTPHEMLALRGGTEDDLEGDEPNTWTYGLGIKAGLFRVDWARVQHPTLEPTDHFALAVEFNFNPAQVKLEKVVTRDLFSSLYKSYATEPVGSVQVRSLQDQPLVATIGVFVPELMAAPSEQEVVLRPRAVQTVQLTAVLDDRSLSLRGDRPVQVQVTASYQSRRLARKEKAAGRAIAYAPGAIDWSEGVAQAAAFVTPRDPAVEAVAREAARVVALQERDPLGNRNLSYAAAITAALSSLGVVYVPDPSNPYSAIAETERAVDTVHYPYQTLESRSGDCDDTTVLMAALLGNVGVPTRFVDAPGHIFLLVNTGLHERNRIALGVDTSMSVVADEEVWIPFETTALGKGFAEAWRMGAEEVQSWGPRGQLEYVDVAASQARYEPTLPPGDRKIEPLDLAQVGERLAASAATVQGWRQEYLVKRHGVGPPDTASAEALSEVAQVLYLGGDLAGARTKLGQALERSPQLAMLHSNLGVVLAAMDSLDAAEEQWRTALALGDAPGTWLDLGLMLWTRGDTIASNPVLAHGVLGAGGVPEACRLIGIATHDSLERADTAGPDEAELRSLLRRVAESGSARVSSGDGRASLRVPRAATGRRERPHTEVQRYLHWIE